MPPVIPNPDPVGLPAPAWLLQFLLVFTFILHLLAMNFLVGGVVFMGIALRRSSRSEPFAKLGERLSRALPPTMAMTITLGVAPLLFLQVLYGQAYYTTSDLMAWPWFYWHLKSRGQGESFRPRLGLKLPDAPPAGSPRLWLHGVSVGEILAAVPLARELKKLLPGVGLIVTTGTETG